MIVAGCGRIEFDITHSIDAMPGRDAVIDIGAARALPPCAPESSLMACWDFDGDVTDGSGHGHDGTPIDVLYDVGVTGAAARMTGRSTIRITPSGDFDPTAGYTIETWLRIEALPPAGGLAVVFDHEIHFALALEPGGHIRCFGSVYGSGGTYVESLAVLPVGEWVHVACIEDGATMTAAVVAAVPTVGPRLFEGDTISPVAIGSDTQSAQPFQGLLDRMRFWNRPLSQTEICKSAGTC